MPAEPGEHDADPQHHQGEEGLVARTAAAATAPPDALGVGHDGEPSIVGRLGGFALGARNPYSRRRRGGPRHAAARGSAGAAPPRARRARAARSARRRPPAARPRPSISATVTRLPGRLRAATATARPASASRGSQMSTSRPTTPSPSVSLRRIPLASFSFGITTRWPPSVRQERVREPDVLDDAVLVLEEHPVADAQRLGDREHDARRRSWRASGGPRSRGSRRRSRRRRAARRRAGRRR